MKRVRHSFLDIYVTILKEEYTAKLLLNYTLLKRYNHFVFKKQNEYRKNEPKTTGIYDDKKITKKKC